MREDIKYKGEVFYLGLNNYDGYEILVHEPHHPSGTASLLFDVRDEIMGEGDGVYSQYGISYIKIRREDYEYVFSIFKSCVKELIILGEKVGKNLTEK